MTSTSAVTAAAQRLRPPPSALRATAAAGPPRMPPRSSARHLGMWTDTFEGSPSCSTTGTRPVTHSDLRAFLGEIVASSEGSATATLPLIKSDEPYTIPTERGNATVRVDHAHTELTATLTLDHATGRRSVDVGFNKPITLTNPGSLVFGTNFVGSVADSIAHFDIHSLRLDKDNSLVAAGTLLLFGVIPLAMRQKVMSLHFDGLLSLVAGKQITGAQRGHLDLLVAILMAIGGMTAEGSYAFAADTDLERALPLVLDAGCIPIRPGTMHHGARGTVDLRRSGAVHFTVAKDDSAEHQSHLATVDLHGSGQAAVKADTGVDASASLAISLNAIDVVGVLEPTGNSEATRIPLTVCTGDREQPPVTLFADLFYDGRGLRATGSLTLTDVTASAGRPGSSDPDAAQVSFPLCGGTVATTGIDATVAGKVSFCIEPDGIAIAGPVDLIISDASSRYEVERELELKIDTRTGAVVIEGQPRVTVTTH